MLPPNNDQQIKYQLILEMKDALEKSDKLRQNIDAIKEEMKQLQAQSNKTLMDVTMGFKQAAEESVSAKRPIMSQFTSADPETGKPILTGTGKESFVRAQAEFDAANKALEEYKNNLRRAYTELNKEQQVAAKASAVAVKEAEKEKLKATQEAEKERLRLVREAEKQKAQLLKEAEKEERAKNKRLEQEASRTIKTKEQLEKQAMAQSTLASNELFQLEVTNAREKAKVIRENNLAAAMTDKERAKIAIQATNEARDAYIKAVKQEATARRELATALRLEATAPGTTGNIVEVANAQVEAAKRQVAVTKGIVADAKQHQRAIETANARMATSFLRLGNALKYAFMGGLAFGILAFFQQLPALITKATEAAVEFSKSLLELAVGLREMRRRTGEAPMFATVEKDIKSVVESFKGLYSVSDVTEAYAASINKLSKMGAGYKQVSDVVKTSAVLAQLNNSTLKETTTALSTYLNSGVSQGLESTGLVLGRGLDRWIAYQEGLKSATLDGIDPATKAMLRLKYVLQQIEPQMKELSTRPVIIANQWDAANNSMAESEKTLGAAFAPFVIRFKEGWADILNFFTTYAIPALQDFYVFVVETIARVMGRVVATAAVIRSQLELLKAGKELATYEEVQAKINSIIERGAKKAREDIEKDFIKGSKDALAAWADEDVDVLGPIIGGTEEDAAKLEEFWTELFKQLNDLVNDYNNDLLEAERDHLKEEEDLRKEYQQKILDAEREYREKLEDLARKNQQDIADEYTKYQQGIEDANREYQQKLADAQREYRDNEINAEEEFQKKLKRLREDFLFDLDDAVRERDARQIMSLIKRYNVDRQRMIEDFQDEKQERQNNYKDQLEDIRLWRERRLQELAIEHQRRLEEIQIEYQREQEEAARARDQELAELTDWLADRQEEIDIAHEEELAELKRHFEDRMAEILSSLMAEKGIQKEYADAIADLIKKVFGPGGKIENSYDNFNKVVDESMAKALESLAIIEQLNAALAAATPAVDPLTGEPVAPTTTTGGGESPYPDGEPSGERNLPDNPNSEKNKGVSEFGINTNGVASLLSSGVASQITTPTTQAANQAEASKSTKVEIYLSDGLEASIIDGALSDMIEILGQIRKQ